MKIKTVRFAILLWSAFFLITTVPLTAFSSQEDQPTSPESMAAESESETDEAELNRLLNILDKHTEIATKSNLNADYVPGTVTVLRGDELQARGVQTVWEALSLVPGMETTISRSGTTNIVIRGVGKTGVSGKVQVQLNGMPINSLLFGTGSGALYLPIAQVDRIDLISGPGSAVHGEYAYTGVINIITKKEGRRLNIATGSSHSYGGGGLYSFEVPKKELSLSLNLAMTQTDGPDSDSGEDRLYNVGMGAISNAPGPVNEADKTSSAFLDFGFKGFSLSTFFLERGWGDHFGLSFSLPPPSHRQSLAMRNLGAKAGQKLKFSPDMDMDVSLSYFRYEYCPELLFLQPPGYVGIYTNGLWARPYYREGRINGSADFTWKGWRRQTVKLGYAFAKHNLDDVWQETNYVPSTYQPLAEVVRWTGDENWLDEGTDRLLHSFTLQDEVAAGDAVDVTAGLRFDDYDDVGTALSPRLSAVWRVTETHILKAQYARAFRPPTFSELYARNSPVYNGNIHLESETIDTFELGYIFHAPMTVLRTTLYYSKMENLIIPVDRVYTNAGDATLRGVELFLEQRLGRRLKLEGTLSYNDPDEDGAGAVITEVADWLGNIGLLYEAHRDLMFNLRGRYVGDRTRVPSDSRDHLSGYFAVDASGSIFNFFTKGLTLRVGVKNIFDTDVRDPSEISTNFLGNPIPTYADDYPRPGRRWWMNLSYSF